MKEIRIIASASDAGGAANVAPVCAELKKNTNIKILSSTITQDIFNRFGIEPEVIKYEKRNIKNLLNDIIDSFDPHVILTGTSRFASPDRYLIKLGREKEIFSVTILDEWYNYKLRFLDETGQYNLSDVICCPDHIAYNEAVADGIPEKLLRITGSPALALFWDRINNNSFEMSERVLELLKKQKPIILFLSETHKSDYGFNEEGGPLGPSLGFTEETVMNDLIEVLSELAISCTLIEKLHPSSEKNEQNDEVIYNNVRFISLKNTSLHSLISISDLIVGMRSMALLESSFFNKPVISYQPELNPRFGQCTAERVAGVSRISSKKELKSWIENRLHKSILKLDGIVTRPDFACVDSVEKIVNLIVDNSSIKLDSN